MCKDNCLAIKRNASGYSMQKAVRYDVFYLRLRVFPPRDASFHFPVNPEFDLGGLS